MKCLTLAAKTSVAFIVLVLLLLMTPESAYAVQPSQQYAKLFYSPYYVASMMQNQNKTFAFTIAPPDGFSGAQSAVLNFQVYAAPSVTFTLYVDNKSCSPASFTISTSYAGASLLPFSFDCSGVVNHVGAYTAKLAPSEDTGAGYGWLDITYSNKPQNGQLAVHGTEYRGGDMATSFVSLTDNNQAAINNAVCYLDLYAPYSYNITHPEILDNQLMLFKEKGLYYYDYLIPANASSGIYMMNVNCRYAQYMKFYAADDLFNAPNLTSTTALDGANQVLNSYEDGLYVENSHAGDKVVSNFTFTNLTYANLSTVAFNVFYQSEDNGGTMTVRFWNWTSGRFAEEKTISLPATGSGGNPTSYDDFKSVTLNVSDVSSFLSGGKMIVGVNSTKSKKIYWNAAYLTFITYDLSSYPPDIRGSGEIHVSPQNYTVDLIGILSGQDKIISNITSTNHTLHSALASNFSQVLGNESLIRSDISSVNSTLLSQFSSLTSYLGTHFGYVLGNMTAYFSALNGNLIGNFTEKDLAIESVNRTLHDSLSSNFSYTDGLVSGVGASVISTNDTLHDSISGLGLEIYDVGLDVLSTNATLHSSISSAESDILGEESNTQYSVWFANGTLHDSLFGNFTYTNAFINDTNTSIYYELMSLNFTGNLTEQINATLPTGFFTKMSNLAAGFWMLVVVAILGALWWFFR